MEREETIKRWAESIVPSVLIAEGELLRQHPKWTERLRTATEENSKEVMDEYFREIAEIIVSRTTDDELSAMQEYPESDESYDDGEVWP